MKTPSANVTDAMRIGQSTGGRGAVAAGAAKSSSSMGVNSAHRPRRSAGSSTAISAKKSSGRSSARVAPASELRGVVSTPLRSSPPKLFEENMIAGKDGNDSSSEGQFSQLPAMADSSLVPARRSVFAVSRQAAVNDSGWLPWLQPMLRSWNNGREQTMFSVADGVDINSNINPKFKTRPKSEPILVTVNVLGSAGPLRLLVSKTDSVLHTINLAVKEYTWQRRQPALTAPSPCFGLYCHDPDFQVLDGQESIGDRRVRQFHLYYKDPSEMDYDKFTAMAVLNTPNPVTSWVGQGFSRFHSWTTKMIGNLQQCVSILKVWLSPWKKYRVMYTVSMNVFNH